MTVRGYAGNMYGFYFPINEGWVFVYNGSEAGFIEYAPEAEMDRCRPVKVTITAEEVE